MRDEPSIKLQEDDKGEHGHDCGSTTAKDEKRENPGNGSDDNAKYNSGCGDQRRMLEVLLGKKLMPMKPPVPGLW